MKSAIDVPGVGVGSQQMFLCWDFNHAPAPAPVEQLDTDEQHPVRAPSTPWKLSPSQLLEPSVLYLT